MSSSVIYHDPSTISHFWDDVLGNIMRKFTVFSPAVQP